MEPRPVGGWRAHGAAARGRGHGANRGWRKRHAVPCSTTSPSRKVGSRGARGNEVRGRDRGRKRLGRDTALRLALGKSAHVAAAASDNASPGLLGKREADVAGLVADGLTNGQLGARLFISERTVDSHVRSILNKLGFNSRAQIAAWMASSNQ